MNIPSHVWRFAFAAVSIAAAVMPAPSAELKPNIPGDIRKIVFAERTVPSDGHWYANIGYAAPGPEVKRYGHRGRLCVFDMASGQVTDLIDDPEGAVRDPQVHYNGRRILFSYRPGGTEHYHLYEIESDGSGLRRLTDGPYDDIEATYLPDDRIVFVSTRCRRWVNCWLTQVAVLYACDADGGHIRQISANIEHDNTPWPLPDGRILYQRWEYIDRSQVHYHHLWTTNPDGTNQMVYYGNLHPGIVMIDAKPILDTQEVVSIFSPGHGSKEHAGHVTVLSQRLGPDDPSAAQQLHKDRNCRDPYALTTDLFLLANHHEMWLMDRQGRHEVIHRLPENLRKQGVWLHEPRPLVARHPERRIADRVASDQTTGTFFLSDVYAGRNMEGVRRGDIKKLLVIESLPKPINYTGGMDPLSYGGTFTLERILGSVPVAADGSAYFEAPALRSLFFIAMDGDGNAVKRMQSFTSVMPGENIGCVGCHEHRESAPTLYSTHARMAIQSPPASIRPIPGIPDIFDFPRDIQPILDRHCVSCHNADQLAGDVLLTGDHGPMFSHSYFELTRKRQIADGRNQAVSNRAPYTIGAVASPLMEILAGGHEGVALTKEEIDTVRYWIEVGAPYPGTYAALGGGMIGGYAENQQVLTDFDWPETQALAEVVEHRCISCHQENMNLPVALSDEIGLSFWQPSFTDPRLRYSRHRLFNLTRPENALMLRAPLAREAGGLGLCDDANGGVFRTVQDPDYAALLAVNRRGRDVLQTHKRFDMPGYRPPDAYIREMKRYGILSAHFDPARDPLDIYQIDRHYWELFELRTANP
jgi:hypothetical protein